jgi:putative redox protein
VATTSDVIVTFPGGKRVDAQVGGHLIRTDQPEGVGGENSAPSPFLLFLSSLATCAGFYIVSFCQRRELSTDGLRLVQVSQSDPETGVLKSVELRIEIPPGFPEQYHAALARVVEQCSVKRAIQAQPRITCRVQAPPAMQPE